MSIGKNTAVGLAADMAIFGLGIIVSIVLTRSLGPEQRGVYILLTTTNALLTQLGHLSVAGAISTMLARGRLQAGEVHTAALLLAFGLGLILFAVATLTYPLVRESVFQNVPYPYLLIALLLIPITIYQVYWNYMMMGLNRLLVLNKLNVVVNITSTVLMILVVGVFRGGVPGALLVWAVSALATAIGGVVLALGIAGFAWPPRRRVLADLLHFGVRSHGANIAHHVFLRFDMYVVNTLVGTAGVGIYSLSTSLAERLWLPLNAIHASSISKIAQLPRDESAQLTARVTRTAVLLMLSAAVPFALVSPWLIPFVYTADFTAAVVPLIILLLGTPAFAVMMVLNSYMQGQMERPGLLSILGWLQIGVSVPLYLVLIAWQGIVGAAVASSVTYLLTMAGSLYVFRRDSGLPINAVLVPRAADFRAYIRVIRRLLRRVPGFGRYADRPS
jgi:O-antigen/teichoic acid export membrane protein